MKTTFTKIVIDWYSIHRRELPWRETKNPYYIWLSEVILQQTQIAQGLPYYLDFVKAYPTVYDLAEATEDQVLKRWQGLGYYSRARNLHQSAKQVVEEFNGQFPDTYAGLLKLKGVGDYTASAVSSICFDAPQAVVDGNVFRLLSRYFGISTPINTTAAKKEFKELAQSLLPAEATGDYNQAVMEFGARQCKPQSPDCNNCVLKSKCVAFNNNMVNQLPVKIRKKGPRDRYFNYLVLETPDSQTVINKRTEKDIWQNLYEFPLVETNKPLACNDLMNHPGFIQIVNGNEVIFTEPNPETHIHKLSHQTINARFWHIKSTGTLQNKTKIARLTEFPVPVLIANYIKESNFVDKYELG